MDSPLGGDPQHHEFWGNANSFSRPGVETGGIGSGQETVARNETSEQQQVANTESAGEKPVDITAALPEIIQESVKAEPEVKAVPKEEKKLSPQAEISKFTKVRDAGYRLKVPIDSVKANKMHQIIFEQ